MNPTHVISFWLSLIILKTLPTEIKQFKKNMKKNKLKLTTLIAHRLFNETCILYIYIYIYINIIYIYISLTKLVRGQKFVSCANAHTDN